MKNSINLFRSWIGIAASHTGACLAWSTPDPPAVNRRNCAKTRLGRGRRSHRLGLCGRTGMLALALVLALAGGGRWVFVPNVGQIEIALAVSLPPLLPPSASAEPSELVKDIFPGANSSIPAPASVPPPQPPVRLGSALFFIANDGASGREIWRSDGTEAGTFLVKDILPGPGSSVPGPQNLVKSGGLVFFGADDGMSGFELWRSDGTEAGTFRVKDIVPGVNTSHVRELADIGGTLFFNANDSNGSELWRSDGTEAGTFMVKDIAPGLVSSDPRTLVDVGGICFFVAGNELGRELWRSDGTEAGTFMVKDIFPFTSSSAVSPLSLIEVGGTLFFLGNDGGGYDLWRSDGSTAGTHKVKDVLIPISGQVTLLVANGGLLFFSGESQDMPGQELWRSDGTEAGTFRVKDIIPGPGTSAPQDLVAAGGIVYFRATDGTSGFELWRSDGTEAGTFLVKNIAPFNNSSFPDFLVDIGGTLFFTASDDGPSGTEVWRSDGTEAGTFAISNVPGFSSLPQNPVGIGGKVFFTADDGIHGREPWVVALNLPPSAADDTATTDEDNALTISVLANDADPNGDPLTLSQVTQGASGSVVINADNTVTYLPATDFNGMDSFTYTAVDTEGEADSATVTVTINPVNDPPVAGDVNAATDEDLSIQINLAATDIDNSDLTFAVVGGPANGTLGSVSGASVAYTPNPNFNGSDSFTFKAYDGMAESNVATVTIMVAPVDDPPAAVTLTPSNDINPVSTEHCVTAMVTDAGGNPVSGTTVRFMVAGAANTAGTRVTGANGQATFCYTGPDLPGADEVTAHADTDGDAMVDDGEPVASTTTTWLVPATTPGHVTGGGRAPTSDSGDEIAFGFNARSGAGGPTGNFNVIDRAAGVRIRCLEVTSLVRDGTCVTLFGNATINATLTTFRIDVADLAEPGAGHDTFRIVTGSGYRAGGILAGGNIQVR